VQQKYKKNLSHAREREVRDSRLCVPVLLCVHFQVDSGICQQLGTQVSSKVSSCSWNKPVFSVSLCPDLYFPREFERILAFLGLGRI